MQLVLLFALLLMPLLAGAQETSEEEAKVKKASLEKEKKKPFYHQGLFYGSLYYVHPEHVSIVVKPEPDQRYNRLPNEPRRFYLDKLTKYFVDGQKAKKEDILSGDKVAVRYWAEDRLGIVEAIYVVYGEYDPRLYRRRVRKGSGIKERKKRDTGPLEAGSKQAAPDAEF